MTVLNQSQTDGLGTKASDMRVGCEGDDGLLRIHKESETCDVCAPTRWAALRRASYIALLVAEGGSQEQAYKRMDRLTPMQYRVLWAAMHASGIIATCSLTIGSRNSLWRRGLIEASSNELFYITDFGRAAVVAEWNS